MKAILQIVEPPGRVVGGQILFRKDSAPPVDLTRLSPKGAAMRAIRGAEIALIPQEPMAAFSPVHTVGDQIIEALRLHERQWRPTGPRLSRREAREMTVDLFRSVVISMPTLRKRSTVISRASRRESRGPVGRHWRSWSRSASMI